MPYSALVRPEAFYERPVPERHRIIFYFGHLEAFDWNLISQAAAVPSFQPEFDHLFAFGIDPKPGHIHTGRALGLAGARRGRTVQCTRPTGTSMTCRIRISEQMLSVALEHRLMHAETFAYLLHSLSLDQKNIPLCRHPCQAHLPFTG